MVAWEHRVASFLHAFRLDSIKNRILVFGLLATLVPSLTTAWVSYKHNRQSLTQKITAELRNISAHSARETDLWLKERFYDVRVFSRSPVVTENLDRLLRMGSSRASDPEALRRLRDYLGSVRDRFTDYEELSVIDPQGGVVASTGDPDNLNLPEDWLNQVETGKEIQGQVYRDDDLGQVMMVIAVPIRAPDERLLGAFSAKVNFRAIDESLRNIVIGETGHAYLLRDDGIVMVSSRIVPAGLMDVALPTATVEALFQQQDNALEYTDPQGNDVVGTLDAVPLRDWAVVAEISIDEAFVQIAELRNQTLTIVVILLLTIGLMAYLLGLTIARPLDRLTFGAAQVAGGDLEVDLPVVTRGELGLMTQVFNDMVARLRSGRYELERLTVTDGLTGLHNRRHLMETCGMEVARADRQEQPLAALMIDLDHFKKYNDTLGHQAGDEVLANMGAIFLDCVREVDYAARYGGEEFLILLPRTNLTGAVEVAERIRDRVAEENMDREDTTMPVTLSIGVAEYPTHGDNADALIAAADAALYQAKRRGRDRIVRASAKKRKSTTRPRGKQARKPA
ncbi:MAG: diguanylate cyclase [Gemmatimonadetes bacterium]|nr:diguanylate cyclase [Gemmatimonadota bacterium]